MVARKTSTKIGLDGRVFMTNRHRRRMFPLTGFLFVMICLWSAKALMLMQERGGFGTSTEVVLDPTHPLTSIGSLFFYPDPVTVWLAETIGRVLV